MAKASLVFLIAAILFTVPQFALAGKDKSPPAASNRQSLETSTRGQERAKSRRPQQAEENYREDKNKMGDDDDDENEDDDGKQKADKGTKEGKKAQKGKGDGDRDDDLAAEPPKDKGKRESIKSTTRDGKEEAPAEQPKKKRWWQIFGGSDK